MFIERQIVVEEVSLVNNDLRENNNKKKDSNIKIGKEQMVSNDAVEKVTDVTEIGEKWEIVDSQTAYVRNSSLFLNAGFLEISGKAVEYFKLDGLKAGETITFEMLLEGKSYLCFARRDSDSGRIMLFWQNDMIGMARRIYRIRRKKSMKIKFTRIEDDRFEVDFVSRSPIIGRRGRRRKKPPHPCR